MERLLSVSLLITFKKMQMSQKLLKNHSIQPIFGA